MNPFRIDEEPTHFRRCENCGGRLMRITQEDLVNHVGHRMRIPQYFTLWETIRWRLGLL